MGLPTESRKDREKQIRKELILSAAREIFLERGWESTTMDEIARRAEFTKRSVYAYFPSKEELFAALITQAVEAYNEAQRKVLHESDTGLDQVTALGIFFQDYCNTHTKEMKLISMSENLPFPKNISVFWHELFRVSQENYAILVEAVDRGRSDGTINSQLSSKMTAFFLMTATQAMMKASQSLVGPKVEALGFTAPEFLKFGMDFIGMALKPGGDRGLNKRNNRKNS